MTDQKVTPCEFVAGLCSNCGATEQLGCEGWVAPADRVQSLAEQVDALTKEREALTANHKECVRCLGEALQDTANVSVERDFLAMANKDLSEAMNQYQQLKAAAKLALDALDEATSYTSCSTWSPSMTRDCQRAIAALRQAGVQ